MTKDKGGFSIRNIQSSRCLFKNNPNSLSGRQVHQQQWKQLNAGQQKQTITVSLKPGTYVLTLANGKEVKSLILIKQ
ncbi:hypothetical protein [Pedobacter segetis]|uniref:hypothetical protein n=1 Tax=Pedobacter segetis TaxID=2793069 RepID=UPI003743719D